ncbi:MAG: sulfatase-like hydrolase/transferase [Deltaproteobacteria bacterium]|nr:sulfatase-like hydrolase/transferase [Deltaproteobacteria bacterium]
MPKKKPNIIFLFSDQHRHDAMGCAGNGVIQTPNLDKMASGGVRFSRAYCQSPVCQPSRASLATGLYVPQHGVWSNFRADFNPEWPTMMRQLQKAGYTTAEVGKTHFYSPRPKDAKQTPDGPEIDLRNYAEFVRSFGFDYVLEEFDRYMHAFPDIHMISPYSEYLRSKGLLAKYQEQVRSIWRMTPNHWDGVTSVLPQEDDLTSFIADQSIDWLKSYRDEAPFFLEVGFVAPHVPLMADPVWAEYYQDASIQSGPRQAPEPPNEIWGDYLENSLFRHSHSYKLTDDYVLRGARQYYGMVSLIDQRIGDIVRVVDELGLSDNTWFLYSADHGEMLGDHNLMAKMNFYKASVNVPAIIKPPFPIEPKVVDGIVETIDLTGTVLDLAGAEPIEESQARSLVPHIHGRGETREAGFSAIRQSGGKNSWFVMAATEKYRLTYERTTDTPCELFDLEEDPDELNNLVNDVSYSKIITAIIADHIKPHLALEKDR